MSSPLSSIASDILQENYQMTPPEKTRDSSSPLSSPVSEPISPGSKKRRRTDDDIDEGITRERMKESEISSLDGSKDASGSEEVAPVAKTTSPKSKKRKALPEDGAEDTTSKKRKENGTSKPAKSSPPKKGDRPRKGAQSIDMPPPPPPLSPASVNPAIANKIHQVQQYISKSAEDFNREPNSADLNRDIASADIMSMPELNLQGIGAIMCHHWELDFPETPLTFLEEAIIERYQQHFTAWPSIEAVNLVTLDLNKETTLEKAILEKIPGHGLGGKKLLKIEIRMFQELQTEVLERHSDSAMFRPLLMGSLGGNAAGLEEVESGAEDRSSSDLSNVEIEEIEGGSALKKSVQET